MKYLWLILVLFGCIKVYGQKISGIITDKTTRQPVSGAVVGIRNSKIVTDLYGRFEIGLHPGDDSLKITHFAYKPYSIAINKQVTVLSIELEPKVTTLNDVTVRGSRDFKKDSLANRLEYTKQFNYKGPRVIDAFTGGDNTGRPGVMLSVNLLVLIEALTKKSTPEYRFNQLLLRDEHEQYIDEKFNRGNVSRVTALAGDALSTFLTRYRPTYEFALKATDYDMEVYIKACFEKFMRDGNQEVNPFVNQPKNGLAIKPH